ncbi:BTB/POZ domain-containing protein KCTD9 [Diorhabda sublineata]|uniref:BTB/POZ domain-containing protein KCTD9 n=1 Tax=Diorhabda sublineata TaxID=1163346 RepID=UPI0024E1945E|nr:BTB/POZ domain-containing protein KCTD9 [Diorhabda sublineata]
MSVKKVILIINGEITNSGLLINLPDDLDDLLKTASCELNITARRLFLEDGTEIKDISYIRNRDKIYFSEGEDFKHSPISVGSNSDWITLNVGGKLFTTSKRTLTNSEPSSMIARMFSEDTGGYLSPSSLDKNGAYLIDRTPTYFEPLLNYLRCGQLVYDKNINPEGILEEAKFFGIESVIPILEQCISKQKQNRDNLPLTRRDVIEALIKSPHSAELRFQGVNLSGADLSRLDLRNINFKYANLQGCNLMGANLSWCCLERADFSHAVLDTAQLLGVKSLCANFEGVTMRNCNFKDPAGFRANMEGVNLKCAILEGSDMGGVNLRVATLKHANLKNCDLRAAVLAGADLENCDLSGSDLHEANLRGANLKDAAFELMLTPLHMSQTIR